MDIDVFFQFPVDLPGLIDQNPNRLCVHSATLSALALFTNHRSCRGSTCSCSAGLAHSSWLKGVCVCVCVSVRVSCEIFFGLSTEPDGHIGRAWAGRRSKNPTGWILTFSLNFQWIFQDLVIKIPTVCVCSLLYLAHLHCLPTIGPAAVALVAAAPAWRTRHG